MTGKYPVGNTGGADVSAFAPMPIPDDLRPLLADPTPWRHREPRTRTTPPTATFSTDIAGLDDATRPDVVELADGDTLELRIAPVAKQLGDDRVRMLAYNGSIPGPTLRVRQGSEIIVHVRNDGDTEATVHWHGLRLDNAYDGVPYETQPPIAIGGEFTYRLRFPDAGLYWYHPHIREDYGLDMGLYGNIVVEPADADYWPPVDREVVVTLDDVLVEDGHIAAFHHAGPDPRRDGPLRQRHAHRRRDDLALDGRSRRGRALLLHQHREHAAVQRRPPRRPHEARRQRQRPLRARDASSTRCCSRRPSGPSSTSASTHPARSRSSTGRPTAPTSSAPSTSPTTGATSSAAADVRRAAHERRADRLARASRRAPSRASPTRRSRSSRSCRSSTATPTRPPTSYTCPMHPDVIATEPGTCPQCGMKLVPAADLVRLPDAPRGHVGHRRHRARSAG